MLNYLRAFAAYFSGKLRKKKGLKKGFIMFLILLAIIWGFTAYNASMSFSYYVDQAGTLWFGPYAAFVITVLIAVAIVLAGAFWIDHVQDWIGGRLTPDRDLWLAIVVFVFWGVAQGWDIHVNFKGIDPVTEYTTQMYGEDKSGQVQTEYDGRIAGKKAELMGVYHHYFWCKPHGKRHDVHDPKKTGNSYLATFEAEPGVCSREKFWFGCSGKTTPCSTHDKHKAQIAQIEQAIQVEDGLRTTAVGIAQGEFLDDKGRYEGEIKDRTETHSYMIIVSYLVIFICTLFTGRYTNQLGEFLDKNYGEGLRWIGSDEEEETPAPEGKKKKKKKKKSKKPLERKIERVASAGAGATIPKEEEQVVTRVETKQTGLTKSDLVEALESVQKKTPPDNTGKSYKKKTGDRGLNNSERVKADLKAFKKSNPDVSKSQAAKLLKGKIGRTSVYKYWDKV